MKRPDAVFDSYDDAMLISEPVGDEVTRGNVVRVCVKDEGPSGPMWVGNRARLRALIKSLQEWEAELPPEVPS